MLLAALVAAGCRKKEPPTPSAAVIDAAGATTEAPSLSASAPSPPDVDAAVVVDAGAASSDAARASSREWKILVPADVGEGAGDPLDTLARAIHRAVTTAHVDSGSPYRFVAYVDTTIDYGCLCPPFVFAPFWNSGRSDGYVLPVFAPGVPEPPLAKQGLYRFMGHFDGRRITGFEWLKMRGEKSEEGMDEYARKAPVFVVEGWCFEPTDEYSDAALEAVYDKTLAKMHADGRFCAGTHMPKHAPK